MLVVDVGGSHIKVLATGGVYLAGGIPMRILAALGDGRFMQAFRSKGRLAELLAVVPVNVIVTRAALIGAAVRGLEEMREKGREPCRSA